MTAPADPPEDRPGPAVPFDATRLAAARLLAADAYPFLAIALFALTPVTAPHLGTFGVDERWRLYVDPEVLQAWSSRECAGVLLHEVGHLVRDHAARARLCSVDEDTSFRWNLAGDAEINDDLRSDAIELPAHAVFPETLHEPPEKAAEYYYFRLLEVPLDDLPDHADCGSGCHGVDHEGIAGTGLTATGLTVDERAELEAALADIDAEPGLDATEAMLLRRRVAEAVLIWMRGRHAGREAGGWVRWATGLLEPQLDWRRLLHGTLRRAVGAVSGAADYSYRRPSRRRVPGVVLPSLVRPLPRAAVVIDTSGSVDDDMLNVAWSEVRGCLRSLGVRRDLLTVYAGDVAVQRIKLVTTRQVALTGGGGTDMAEAIAAVVAQRPRPDVIVVITDGFTPWPDTPPPARLIVALLSNDDDPMAPPTPPAWSKVVPISTDAVLHRA